MYAVDVSFNLLGNGFLVGELPDGWRLDEVGLHVAGPLGEKLVPRGRELQDYTTLRIDVGAPGGPRRPVDFILGTRAAFALSLEPDDYPYATIPSEGPTHEVTMGPYRVVFVEGEPVELDVPGLGTLTLVPWLVESIDVAR
jgi:hypothetical protein